MADGDKELIPEHEGEGGRLGRHRWHDPANRQYPARGVVTPATLPPPRSSAWWTRDVFDQGSESSCTAQAAAGLLVTSPFRKTLPKPNLVAIDEPAERFALYRAAQEVDPWPGGEPSYFGSSTDAPFKVLRARGAIREWRWCFGLDDVRAVLRAHGPVAIGTDWHAGMDRPDRYGRVSLSGGVRGGHAYRLVHDDAGDREVIAVNSWGRPWGVNGRFRLSYDQLAALLASGGEAVTVVA